MANIKAKTNPNRTFDVSISGVSQDVVSKWLTRLALVAVTSVTSYNAIALRQTIEKMNNITPQTLSDILSDPEIKQPVVEIFREALQPLEADRPTVKPTKRPVKKSSPVPKKLDKTDGRSAVQEYISIPGRSVPEIPTVREGCQ